jgi:hypothetical protein
MGQLPIFLYLIDGSLDLSGLIALTSADAVAPKSPDFSPCDKECWDFTKQNVL